MLEVLTLFLVEVGLMIACGIAVCIVFKVVLGFAKLIGLF